MKRFLVVVSLAMAAGGAHADVAGDMKKIADNIRVLKGQWTQGALPNEVNLDYEIGTLSKIIQDGKLNESGLAVAYYYRDAPPGLREVLLERSFFSNRVADYLNFLAARSFVCGTRLHGNMMALCQGVPTLFVLWLTVKGRPERQA